MSNPLAGLPPPPPGYRYVILHHANYCRICEEPIPAGQRFYTPAGFPIRPQHLACAGIIAN